MNKKDKILEDLAMDSQTSILNNTNNLTDLYSHHKLINKITESNLIINLKKQYKELKKEFTLKKEEMEEIKKTSKITKINEIQLENQTLLEEIGKIKSLYEFTLKQNQLNEKNLRDFNLLKENFQKQEFIISSLQDNIKHIQDEIFNKESEINKFNKNLNDKIIIINKLKKDLKFQYQINERLINSTSNIKNTSEYIMMKNEMEKKLGEFKKDHFYYKELSEKRDKRIRDLEMIVKNTNSNFNYNSNGNTNNNLYPNSNNYDNYSSNQDSNILLLKSKLQEVMKERDNYKNLNLELTNKLENGKNNINNIINPDDIFSLSHNNFNQNYDIKILTENDNNSYEYLDDFNLNELIYILIKNFEANKFDINIIQERILKDSNSNDIINILETDIKLFSEKVTNNILNLLKVKKEKDKKIIFSFIKTFIHNTYTILEDKSLDDFKTKFLNLFESITFYSGDQRQVLNKALCKKIYKYKSELNNAISFYDENKTGFISFVILRKILEQIKMKLNNNLIEYFIFVMKNFNDENSSINDLKYENLFKIMNEFENDIDVDKINDENSDEEEKNDSEIENSIDDSAIEITAEEYLKKVQNIINKIVQVLKNNNTNLDDYFKTFINSQVKEYRAIELGKLVQVLNEDFNIILDQIDIYCLFTKLKHLDDEDEESLDEIVDFNKLENEVNLMIKNQNENNFDHKNTNKNNSNNLDIDLDSNSVDTQSKLEIPQEDFIQLIKSYLIRNSIKFEDFILNLSNKIQNSYKQDIVNRFLDLNSFENLLIMNELIISIFDPLNNKLLLNINSYNFTIDESILFNSNRINLDYLKFIIENMTENKISENFQLNKQFFYFNTVGIQNSKSENIM